jgi:hypothetical protein
MCQRARDRVKHLDWASIRETTVESYESLLIDKTPSPRKRELKIINIIRLIPSEEVRGFLIDRLVILDRVLLEEVSLDSKSRILTKAREVKQVSTFTWISLGLTMILSVAAYLFLKPAKLLSRTDRL